MALLSRRRSLLRLALHRHQAVRGALRQFLKLKRTLVFFGGTFRNRQLKTLLRNVRARHRLQGLFAAVYHRLDFFLPMVNLALSGAQARQWALHGHVQVNRQPVRHFGHRVVPRDIVALTPPMRAAFKPHLMRTLVQTPRLGRFARVARRHRLARTWGTFRAAHPAVGRALRRRGAVRRTWRRRTLQAQAVDRLAEVVARVDAQVAAVGPWRAARTAEWGGHLEALFRAQERLRWLQRRCAGRWRALPRTRVEWYQYWQKYRFHPGLGYRLRSFAVRVGPTPPTRTPRHLARYALGDLYALRHHL